MSLLLTAGTIIETLYLLLYVFHLLVNKI